MNGTKAGIKAALKAAFQHTLAWPVLTLVLLIALDVAHRANFLAISTFEGHFFGAPIDILNRAAPLVIVSLGMTLEPGDVISTGTPAGVGQSRTPPEFMVPGNVLESEIDGLGLMRNRIGV